MGRIKLLIVALFVTVHLGYGQVNRYMVFFNDKTGTPFSVSSPENFLSQRAIDRRENQDIAIIEQDLPVTPAYVTAVRNAGATVLYQTKWMNGVLVECDQSLVVTLNGLASVAGVEYVAPGAHPSGRVGSSKKFREIEGVAAVTDQQLAMIGMDDMHDAGYHGEGMLIAIMDAGFLSADTISFFDHIFNDDRFDAATSYDFVSRTANVFHGDKHGMNVWSTMAAFKPSIFVGGAYKAHYILFITEHAPTEYRVEEYNWLFAAERADSAGVDVINTSLGYRTFDDASMNYAASDLDGETTVIARAAQMASSKGMAVVASAGNEGNSTPTTIGSPADAESVLAVGAVNSAGNITGFSSRGPSYDGRIKPDVAAMGAGVSVIDPNGTIRSTANGTSFAGPLTASLVAGVWQMLPDLTAAELLQVIRESGSQFNNPDNFLGYGIPNFNLTITAVDPERKNLISVYPNPSTGLVKILVPENLSAGQINLKMIDARGVEVPVRFSGMNGKELSLDISNQKPGLYVLQCQHGMQRSIHKILKVE